MSVVIQYQYKLNDLRKVKSEFFKVFDKEIAMLHLALPS
jgi:hypothetical protein